MALLFLRNTEPFNPHKAKKIYASREQKEVERYFVKVVREKFRDLKTSKAPDVLEIREKAIEKVFAKFRNDEKIMVYAKNLFVTYDEHERKSRPPHRFDNKKHK